MKIKQGDTVKVISGKDRGKTGKVTQVFSRDQRVVVEGVNKVKKHQKSQGQEKPGGIFEFEAPVHVSNVMVIDPKSNKPSRVGYLIEKGVKVRIAKSTKTKLDK
ncbi:MAG: 50S ribosomal protein L24 [Candidatus Dojkabacteria bacterium]